MSRDRIATYRLQLHEDFTFDDAARIAHYLESLGISHLYLSPILQARPGSHHGYDVIDHATVNSELGGIEGLRALAAAWHGEIVIDIVPNHMAVTGAKNEWWWDVLKHGPGSRYAESFDIDWDPAEERLKRSILIPILGDHYGRVLESGDLKIDLDNGEPVVRYFEHVFPLAPSSQPHDIERLNADLDLLHTVLEAQHYRLAYWKVAGRELNYRRFFAINDLAALRIDRPEVFDAVHAQIAALLNEGLVSGLRVDHIDGLRFPRLYLERLHEITGGAYVVVEKILEGDEQIREDWPIAGTTGYESIRIVDGLFVDPAAEKPLTDLYARFTGIDPDLDQMTVDSKMLIMDTELAADIERLTDLFVAVCEDQRRFRDFTRPELRQALRETIASFEVYRTYVEPERFSPADAHVVTAAISDAMDRRPELDPDLFRLLGEVLLGRVEGEDELALALRFQQTSGPVMAKGIEDTLFYRYNRAAMLNEVGGDPARFGCSIDDFHRFNLQTQERWPLTMRAGSTHDTKRSEDVRARLALLTEMPAEWERAVERWADLNARHKAGGWPDPNLEYLLYQTLVGAWPLSVERAREYVEKAGKEAKVHSSWLRPNPDHDDAVKGFVERILGDRAFVADLEAFVEPLVNASYVNSLTACLLRLTVPGVPDIYQGTEVWDHSLVDPDNRRPVDYQERTRLLDAIKGFDGPAAWKARRSGAPKLFVMHHTLQVRARRAASFGPHGDYLPLQPTGSLAGHVVAFARGRDVVAIVPRLMHALDTGWDATSLQLPEGTWTNAFGGETHTGTVPVREVLARFPVALLERGEG